MVRVWRDGEHLDKSVTKLISLSLEPLVLHPVV